MKATFNYPTRILFGQGVIADLPAELLQIGGKRPLLVTDPGLVRAGLAERVRLLLRQGGTEPKLFTDVAANPTDIDVEAGTVAFLAHGADSIVALGGGSPMDAAKAIQIRVNHHEPLERYDDLTGGDALITEPFPPLVAVPTTAGTGSEVSRSAVVTVGAVERKVVLFSPRLMPNVAICDPELTYDLPPRITAETGMDALSHSLEAYLSTGYHPMADSLGIAAIRNVARYLPTAVDNGHDVLARQEMMMAGTMGAVAFQKGLGVIHSLAHPLSSVLGIGHGLANAVLLPHAMRFNAEAIGERAGAVAHALCATDRTAEGAAEALMALSKRVGLATRLYEIGVTEKHLPKLVEKAMADGCHGSNPRPCTPDDMEAILRAAL